VHNDFVQELLGRVANLRERCRVLHQIEFCVAMSRI
jgi:hypothetical protein